MGFLQPEAIKQIGFNQVGQDVLISDRAVFYEPHLQKLGDRVRIDDFCILSGRVELGRNVHIAVQTNLAGGEPGIMIGDFSGTAYNCQVFAQSDDYSGASLTGPTVPRGFKREKFEAVTIGRHVILGAASVVLPGSVMNDGAACMAMSLVAGELEPWSLYGGVPARRIAARDTEALILEQEYRSKFG